MLQSSSIGGNSCNGRGSGNGNGEDNGNGKDSGSGRGELLWWVTVGGFRTHLKPETPNPLPPVVSHCLPLPPVRAMGSGASVRSPVRRWIGPKAKKSYDAMNGEAKAKFRMHWAQREIQNMKETFSKGGGGELEKEEEVEKEDWVVYNSMTERYEFLYVKN